MAVGVTGGLNEGVIEVLGVTGGVTDGVLEIVGVTDIVGVKLIVGVTDVVGVTAGVLDGVNVGVGVGHVLAEVHVSHLSEEGIIYSEELPKCCTNS